jgi:hypothetical protein
MELDLKVFPLQLKQSSKVAKFKCLVFFQLPSENARVNLAQVRIKTGVVIPEFDGATNE